LDKGQKSTVGRDPLNMHNLEPRTQNPELRTQNSELRTQNSELRTIKNLTLSIPFLNDQYNITDLQKLKFCIQNNTGCIIPQKQSLNLQLSF